MKTNLETKLSTAGIWREEHNVLDTGRHSFDVVDMSKLSDKPRLLADIVRQMAERWDGEPPTALVVPDKTDVRMLKLAKFPFDRPVVCAIKTDENGTRMPYPPAEEFVRRATRLAIFASVLSSAETVLAAQEKILSLSRKKDVSLGLMTVWRRELLPDLDAFSQSVTLINHPLPSWPAEVCTQCQSV